ncbi:cysteine hydrolase family protein (plasmid) [Roseomonas sp. OT10]|uniref:cysteine hydrolase family protein n=1 Tax=Roseomonas cutis TaxID=2897332 RepID=UPI001E3E0149|nr:cysteine hydrolase family protein [Roseomonas sp. OT10]UFN51559.1 cysteine hydrolase family protein [Roseomonas sp. OT10]
MKPDTTALLLIEFQNDFVSEGGVQHDAVKAVMAETGMLAHAQTVAKEARRLGVTVLHAPIAFAAGYPEIPAEPYGILAGIKQVGAFRKGSWGAAFAESLIHNYPA